MKAWLWAMLGIVGFLMMVGSYERWMRIDPEAPWSSGFVCVGDGEPAEPLGTGLVVATRLRYLPLGVGDERLLKAIGTTLPEREQALRARLRRKLIELPAVEAGLLVGWLAEGRMPEPGAAELLGGADARPGEKLTIGERPFQVVGVLRPSVALLADSLLAVADKSTESLFAPGDPEVSSVRLIRLTAGEFRDRKLHEQIEKAYPSTSFVRLAPQVVTPSPGYYVYLAGQALFLLGGTGVLIAIYRRLAGRTRGRLIDEPLAEIAGRPRLFWGVHLAYFGLYFLGAVLIHENRALHAVLMSSVQQALASQGPLGDAAQAYQSGSILRAAGVTFKVNFLYGSLLQITLPSLIVPGCGVLLASFRALLWGLLLGPADTSLALAMIPHSGTLLLEGEGYILATFFALLIPLRLSGSGRVMKAAPSPGGWELAEGEPPPASDRLPRRLGLAALLNLKGAILVAVVLAVAAIYEATEVIWMAGL